MQDLYDYIAYWCDGKTTLRLLMAGVAVSPHQLCRAKARRVLMKHGTDSWMDAKWNHIKENHLIRIWKSLLEHGADVHAMEDSALRWASEEGHLEVVRILLEHGADVHAGYVV